MDDDGMVVIRRRLTPVVGAVVQRTLEAAADRLFRDSAATPTGHAMAEELTPAQRRADALALLAESVLAANCDGGTAGDRYQVVVHVTTGESGVDRGASATNVASDTFEGALEVDHGAVYVSMETAQRLSCDGSLVRMRHDADGAVVAVGRRTRTIPPSIRRALAARDTSCRFPGCTSRRCDAHHVEHWADGGATRLDDLVLLCRRHHRAVHEGGFGVMRGRDGVITLRRPDGAPLQVAPAAWPQLPGLHDATPRVTGASPTWDGTCFDLAWAIDVLYRRRSDPNDERGRGQVWEHSRASVSSWKNWPPWPTRLPRGRLARARHIEWWSWWIAACCAFIGEETRAIAWLGSAFERGFMNYRCLSRHSPVFRTLDESRANSWRLRPVRR